MEIGSSIRKARKEKGLTQIKLAEMTDMAVNSIRLYESGKRIPSIDQRIRIAYELDCSPFDLMTEDEVKSFTDSDSQFQSFILIHNDMVKNTQKIKALEFAESVYARDIISAFELLNERGKEEAARSVSIIAGNPVFQRKNATEPADPNADTQE